MKEPKQQIEDVAQLFLGVRMQCAQCHHHPFERWSQDDYYALSAFFSQVGRKPSAVREEDMIFHKRGLATATNVKTGHVLKPAAFGDAVPDIAADEDPRLRLADWMSSKDNPFFAKGAGESLLEALLPTGLDRTGKTTFAIPTRRRTRNSWRRSRSISSRVISISRNWSRVITRSHAYQLGAQPNESNIADRQNYSRYYPRRMQAEVLLDAVVDRFDRRADGLRQPAPAREPSRCPTAATTVRRRFSRCSAGPRGKAFANASGPNRRAWRKACT